MSRWLGVRYSIRSFLSRQSADAETREELAYHLARQTEKHVAAGMTHAEAARLAAIELGGTTRWRDETSSARLAAWVHDLVADFRYAARGLAARPVFALAAVSTAAVGIGASASIIALANGALLRPLPFPESNRLMSVALRMPRNASEVVDMVWSYPKFIMLRDRQTVFSSLALHDGETAIVAGADGAERAPAEAASAAYFGMLGAAAAVGRTYGGAEDQPDGPSNVVLLSDGYWRARFAARTSVLGETMQINGRPHTIIGVMPPRFRGLSGDVSFWLPITDVRSARMLTEPGAHNMELVAERRPGVSAAAARAAVEALGREIDAAFPSDNGHWGAKAYALDELRVNPAIRRSIRLMLIAAALLLAMAVINLATLVLSRSAGRVREFAVRAALGAGRGRLMRQLFAETLVVIGASMVLGVAIAWIALRVLATTLPLSVPTTSSTTDLTPLTFGDIRLDATSLGAALAAAAFLIIVAAAASLGVLARRGATLALRQGASSAAGARLMGSSALVVGQVAIALTFVVAAALTIESLSRALAVPLGYAPSSLLSMSIALDPARTTGDSSAVLWRDLLADVRRLPGVKSAALGGCSPLGMKCDGTSVAPLGHPNAAHVTYLEASPDYFATLKTPVLRGRAFTSVDVEQHRPVAMINRTAARLIWGRDDPLLTPIVGNGQRVEIVGVVDDARYGDVERPAEPAVIFPFSGSRGVLFVRFAGDEGSVARAIRTAVRRAGAGNTIGLARTMDSRLRDATARNRLIERVFTSFGAAELLLAAIGVYGMLALRVTLRAREHAIRRALGASAASLARMVGRQAAAIAGLGTAIGIVTAALVSRALASLLYGVDAFDWRVYAPALVLLLLTIACAAAGPAARSFRADPCEAMRSE